MNYFSFNRYLLSFQKDNVETSDNENAARASHLPPALAPIIKAKGVPKILRERLNRTDYRNAIFSDRNPRREMYRRIASVNHRLYLAKSTKRVLSALDTKRFWYPCQVHSISLYRADAIELERLHWRECAYLQNHRETQNVP